MLSRRGHIPDDHTPNLWVPVSKLIGATPAPAPMESPGLVMWADRIESQPGNSCVGHGIAGAIYAKEGAENAAAGEPNRPRAFPAPLGIYYVARKKGGYEANDDGCQARLAYEGLVDYGYCAIEDWPSVEANIRKQPPAETFRLGADNRFIQFYRIINEGGAGVEDIRQALSKQNPITFALQVDLSFESLKDGVWNGPTGAIAGGHYVWGVEYNFEYVTIANSWDRNWGVNGFGKVSWAALANPGVTSDRYAITLAATPYRVAA
jgi:hypothetical protein